MQCKPKNKAGFKNLHEDAENKESVRKLMEELSTKGVVTDKNSVWNSSGALFGPDGDEP